jgi:hypothetical protein
MFSRTGAMIRYAEKGSLHETHGHPAGALACATPQNWNFIRPVMSKLYNILKLVYSEVQLLSTHEAPRD